MTILINSALAFVLALGGTRATAQPREVESTPNLRLIETTGKIRITTAGEPAEIAEGSLPFLLSGSIVKAISGRARFESDYHVEILAKASSGFVFVAHEPDGTRPGSLHLAAIGPETTTLLLNIGGQKFRIGKEGALSIAWSGRREVTVTAEAGNVRLMEVDPYKGAGFRMVVGVREGGKMTPGDMVIVAVPTPVGFERASVNPDDLRITRKNARIFEATLVRPNQLSELAREEAADRIIAAWPATSQYAAEWALEKYGVPHQATVKKLAWNGNGPWLKTTVYRDQGFHGIPQAHQNILQQSIRYSLTAEEAANIARIHIDLDANHETSELAAISESENTNFLALNLADQVARGKRTPETARDFYFRTISMSNAGKFSPYMDGLLFDPSK